MVGVTKQKKLSQGSRVAKKLAIRTSRFWPDCHLGITLMSQNDRALLGRSSVT